MNGKRAKRLRREAERATVGELTRDYRAKVTSKGDIVRIFLSPNCTRKVYKEIKARSNG